MGTLIAIDGLDGSGKGTQSKLLYERLISEGIPARLISFPVYDSPSSTLVRMYLSGEFGQDPDCVNCYAASAFYALDRYATYAADWKRDYEAGVVIVADRYTTANAIHQLTKLPEEKRAEFLSWLSDFEYGKLSIPAPDLTLFLEVEVQMSLKLIDHRERKKDIHENADHLRRAFAAAQFVCEQWNWERVRCVKDGVLDSRKVIADRIWDRVRTSLPHLCR